MKRTRYIWLLFVCACMAFSLCACTLITNKLTLEVADQNGEEDYSLAVLTEEDICAEDNACYCAVFGLTPSGSRSYAEDEYMHDADVMQATASSPLSGVSLLQSTYGVENVVTFTVECTRTVGNVRIVLLDENLNIVHDFSVAEKSSYTVQDAKDKEFEIRVAGESAEFTVHVSREFSNQ